MMYKQDALRVDAPSPLVGEGYTAGRPGLGWVRGPFPAIALSRQPLTRLRFAKPPSPARGEGEDAARLQ
jgi:hypothetical protein